MRVMDSTPFVNTRDGSRCSQRLASIDFRLRNDCIGHGFVPLVERCTAKLGELQRQEISVSSEVNGCPTTRSLRRFHNCRFLLSRQNISGYVRSRNSECASLSGSEMDQRVTRHV